MKSNIILIFGIIIVAIILIICSIVGINYYMVKKYKAKILSIEELKNESEFDCALVLGAGVRGQKPTDMLADRIKVGNELYENQVVKKLVMSGDHGKKDYDEVNVMKTKAIEAGVLASDIFMDHAGFSTYESLYRVKEIFGAKKIVIVSQEYHLYRALYIAEQLDIEAYGISANLRPYTGQTVRDQREYIARCKDVLYCLMKPEPTYLGEKIDLNGDRKCN